MVFNVKPGVTLHSMVFNVKPGVILHSTFLSM